MDLAALQIRPEKHILELRVAGPPQVRPVDFNLDAFLLSLNRHPKRSRAESAPHRRFVVKVHGRITLQASAEAVHLEVIPPQLYKLSNRTDFTNSVVDLLKRYNEPLKNDMRGRTCDNVKSGPVTPFTHQKILTDYLNINTPYRGLVVYHGLGSGKTCSSIAVAEGFLKSVSKIYILTPKSLERNYRDEIFNCSQTFKRLQHWVRTDDGWTNSDAEPNFTTLSESDQDSIEKYLQAKVSAKFKFVHYNGLTQANLRVKFPGKGNPFDKSVVVIDEVHNLVSRIVNKLKGDETAVSNQLYEWLLSATDCRVVALSGTPMINYSYELGVLFNLLRGYIRTWTLGAPRANSEDVLETLKPYINYKSTTTPLVLTRTPDHFLSVFEAGKYVGVRRTHDEWMSDAAFTKQLEAGFGSVEVAVHKALPDTERAFDALDAGTFQRRILGLTSYFPDLTGLMPTLHRIVVHRIEMSDHQFKVYEEYRATERESERKKKDSSSYRMASRKACNFVFPKSVATPLLEEDEEVAPETSAQIIRTLQTSGVFKPSQLSTYSPKYAAMLETIQAREGLHLVYSNFLTLEGLNIFAAVLEANRFEPLALGRKPWRIVGDTGKSKYVMYTGQTPDEEREILRNIYNKKWEEVPEPIRTAAQQLHVPIFMITAAGAEGINLLNVLHVHVMEPYWHPVRVDQVIGRARRICSHSKGVEGGVTPHIYLMTVPADQRKNAKEAETTDEYLYDLAAHKKEESRKWLHLVQQTAIECNLQGMGCYRTNQILDYVSVPGLEEDIAYGKASGADKGPLATFEAIRIPKKIAGRTVFVDMRNANDRGGEIYYPVYANKTGDELIGYYTNQPLQFYFPDFNVTDRDKFVRVSKTVTIGKPLTFFYAPGTDFMPIYKTRVSDDILGYAKISVADSKATFSYYDTHQSLKKPAEFLISILK